MKRMPSTLAAVLAMTSTVCGCHKHQVHVTAVPLSPWNCFEPEGIPYYLPKPLLVVAKNVRHIDETKVGLTNPAPIPNAFDNQASYADIKANVTVPGTAGLQAVAGGSTNLPSNFDTAVPALPNIWEKMTPDGTKRIEDGLTPDSFFTYQIVFVPDLSQKYGLRIKGGPGEVRAAMNLVNGWMYTGMGPYYMKDSSTAQNIMALGVGAMFAGRGTADVLNQVGELAKVAGTGQGERAPAVEPDELVNRYTRLLRALQTESVVEKTMLNYAEIYIYEPDLQRDGSMGWRLIAEHHFDRQYLQGSKVDPELLKSILGAERSERAEARNVMAEDFKRRTEEARTERAKVEARAERAAAGGLFMPSIPSPAVTIPGGLPGGVPASPATALPSLLPADGSLPAAPAPAPARPTDEMALSDLERRMLNLPVTPTTTANPTTQVNVDVNPSRQWPLHPHSLFHKKQPPKIQTRSINISDVNEGGIGTPFTGPGSSVER
jgi:hypothetical protein